MQGDTLRVNMRCTQAAVDNQTLKHCGHDYKNIGLKWEKAKKMGGKDNSKRGHVDSASPDLQKRSQKQCFVAPFL